jgi:hypothetical protein
VAEYELSELWRQLFKHPTGATFENPRKRLQVAYEHFWQRAIALAQRISADLPGLTLHDKEHLSALWDRASQLVVACIRFG